MDMEEKIQDLERRTREAELGGGEKKIQEQHAKGKMTARERIDYLLDKGSFQEIDKFVIHRCRDFGMDRQKIPGDGVVTGHGTIHGRTVFLFSQDFTVLGGSLSETVGQKICKVMDLALQNGAPMIGVNDSGGARIQEGVMSLGAYGEIFKRNVWSSGVIPQISVIMGPCAGGAVYSPALTDLVIMVQKTSNMFITGPQVIKAVTGEEVTAEELGGARTHNTRSGVAHFSPETEQSALDRVKEILAFLPQNCWEKAPVVPSADDPERRDQELNYLVPSNPKRYYDIKAVIRKIVDNSYFLEVQRRFAQNMVIGFGRLNGLSVGIIANQPRMLAGCLDINASVKCSRFVRMCDAFNLPLLTFVDVPGYLPGLSQEYGGIIKHGAKILFAYAEATVPKIAVVVRKAYGGAYIAMASKHLAADINFAYPTAEIAVMGAEGAANIIFKKEIDKAPDPAATREKLIAEYGENFENPYRAAEVGYIDEVIRPDETRSKLIKALMMLQGKKTSIPKRRHGNIPL